MQAGARNLRPTPRLKPTIPAPAAGLVTHRTDWQPVREGSLTLLLRGRGGAREEIEMPAPDRLGVYTATPTLTASGTSRADMTLAAGGTRARDPHRAASGLRE